MRRLLLCTPLFAALGGCVAPSPPPGDPASSAIWRDDISFVLTGVLAAADPQPGAPPQCPVLLADDGRIFALIGDLSAFSLGDRVRISGPPAIWSTCQTYQTVKAEEILPLK